MWHNNFFSRRFVSTHKNCSSVALTGLKENHKNPSLSSQLLRMQFYSNGVGSDLEKKGSAPRWLDFVYFIVKLWESCDGWREVMRGLYQIYSCEERKQKAFVLNDFLNAQEFLCCLILRRNEVLSPIMLVVRGYRIVFLLLGWSSLGRYSSCRLAATLKLITIIYLVGFVQ